MQNQERKQSPYEQLNGVSSRPTLNPECFIGLTVTASQNLYIDTMREVQRQRVRLGTQETEMSLFSRNLNPSVMCPA